MNHKRKLPHRADRHPAPEGVNAIDSMMIWPQSHGLLNAGQFSKSNKPDIKINISSARVNNVGVEWNERMLGNEKKFTLIYQVDNYTDSPAFAYIYL